MQPTTDHNTNDWYVYLFNYSNRSWYEVYRTNGNFLYSFAGQHSSNPSRFLKNVSDFDAFLSANWYHIRMRSIDVQNRGMFSYVTDEERIPQDHPLRAMSANVNIVLKRLSRALDALYSPVGRPSIPPEHLLRALLLQVLYGIRSEVLLIEQLHYNLLFRWFVGIGMDDPVWHATTFSKNRDRLLDGDIAREFFAEVLKIAREHDLLSDEHFTVDGTLIEAWASHKSFRPKNKKPPTGGGSNPDVDFRGTKRKNETHASTTDPDARLYRKGRTGAQLVHMAHALMENRNGLVVDTRVTHATGTAEREAALSMMESVPGRRRVTLGADKGYDAAEFVQSLREINVTPHIAANDTRSGGSALDARTVRHRGYEISQRRRKLVEQIFGWMKTAGGLRKTRHRGRHTVDWIFAFGAAAYNLVRLSNLTEVST
jgi:transposase